MNDPYIPDIPSRLPEMCSSTTACRASGSCQKFLHSIIKTGAKGVNPGLLIFQVSTDLHTLSESECQFCATDGLDAQKERKSTTRCTGRNILKPLLESSFFFFNSVSNEQKLSSVQGESPSFLSKIVVLSMLKEPPEFSRNLFNSIIANPNTSVLSQNLGERMEICVFDQPLLSEFVLSKI